MTPLRLFIILLVGIVAEVGAFRLAYADLIGLREPASVVAARPHACDNVADALTHKRLTREHLERVADVARRCDDLDTQIDALGRLRDQLKVTDPQVLLRLGEALRRAERLDEAERAFRQLVHVETEGSAR